MESYELNIYAFEIKKEKKKINGRDPKWNKKNIVGIIDGKVLYFESSYHAARILKFNNIKTGAKNIQRVCHGERKAIMGIMWFFADDIENYKELIY